MSNRNKNEKRYQKKVKLIESNLLHNREVQVNKQGQEQSEETEAQKVQQICQ